MFWNANLPTRLIGSFLLMGLIVFVVAIIGWSGNQRLSAHIVTLTDNSLPSVIGLWKINQGQTKIESSERLMFDPRLTKDQRQAAYTKIEKSWKQIDEGFKQYETTPRSPEEQKNYQIFLQDWELWKQSHEQFIKVEGEFQQLGIRNPWAKKILLAEQKNKNSSENENLAAAFALSDQLSRIGTEEESLFAKSTNSLLAVLRVNEEIAEMTKKKADEDVSQSTFWVSVGIILGPLTAIILGLVLSKTLIQSISSIINLISSSATQIAASVEQHERIASEQASSVSETTSTMDELNASSRQAAEQAEAAAEAARQVAQQMIHLSEQTRQIGSITTTVSELASQTNMLALNAAVEAVRAGDSGKGFGVVASEIRRLAEESKKSAQNISNLIADIQMLTDSTVRRGDDQTRFENIVVAVNNIVINSQQISLTAKQQAIAIRQVVAAMSAINVGAQETASGISQTKIGTQKLKEAAQNLKALGVG